jgi:hypothetical protein
MFFFWAFAHDIWYEQQSISLLPVAKPEVLNTSVSRHESAFVSYIMICWSSLVVCPRLHFVFYFPSVIWMWLFILETSIWMWLLPGLLRAGCIFTVTRRSVSFIFVYEIHKWWTKIVQIKIEKKCSQLFVEGGWQKRGLHF